ncbi:MAG: hypothetical protein D6705_03920 [Deltaproteobacteria bacterium]|nr:MAG: hypothetical protein D6705_03920 [Deltaproteobacteria bacterium]
MALHLYRSNRVERLVDELADLLPTVRPNDPFVPVPVVVGSAAMGRWLAHEIATRRSVAAGIVYPLPRRGISAAMRAILDGTGRLDRHLDAPDRFEPDALALRLLPILHAERDGTCADFARSITTREAEGRIVADWPALAFAREVADVLDRLLHEAPACATAWARGRGVPARHRWLAHLLTALGAASDEDSPAAVFERLEKQRASGTNVSLPPLLLFGLSTVGPGDRARISLLARHLDVHLFSVVPTAVFFVPGRTAPGAPHAENPVLGSLGRASRALVDLVIEQAAVKERDLFDAPTQAPSTLLERLQAWIAEPGDMPTHDDDAWDVDPSDDSISFHAAPGALRQCEVVREILLDAFARDATLMPRDVVIQTPDPATYAPLMALVLARVGIAVEGDRRERLYEPVPAVAADVGLREQNAVAEILLRLLRLAAGRITATAVAELLDLEPVQRALGLDPEAAAAIPELLAATRFTWGGCADDRGPLLRRFSDEDAAALLSPERVDDQFTARFGAERLALGVCQHDPGPLWVQGGAPEPHVDVAPVPVESTERAGAAAALALALGRLDALHHALQTPRTVDAWVGLLSSVLDEWCTLPPERAFLRREVDDVLDAYRRIAEGTSVLLSVDAVTAYLERRLDRPVRGDRPVTGAVTISGLEPMRVVPFRMVVLLGMDDGIFPRTDTRPAFDPFASGAPNDRPAALLSRADVDRHILLEALLSARERLVVTFCGRDPRSNERLPAAVPIEELLTVLGALTGRPREALVVDHPLQPYARRAFVEGPTQSADPLFWSIADRRAAIEAGREDARPTTTGLHGAHARLVLPPPSVRPVYTVGELTSWLYRPVVQLLRRRLDLRSFDREHPLSDLDPVDDPAIDEALLLDLLEHRLFGDGDLDAFERRLARRLAAEGRILRGPVSQRLLQGATQGVSEIEEQLKGYGDVEKVSLPVSLDFGDLGRIEDEWQGYVGTTNDERVAIVPIPQRKAPNSWAKLHGMLWAHAFAAAGTGVDTLAVVATGSEACAPLPPADDARAALSDLLEVAHEAQMRPLPLFPRMGEAIANKLVGRTSTRATFNGRTVDEVLRAIADGTLEGMTDPELLDALAKAAAEKFASPDRGDRNEPAIAHVFAGYDPKPVLLAQGLESEEVRLALRVWGRVRTCFVSGGKKGTHRTGKGGAGSKAKPSSSGGSKTTRSKEAEP